MPLTYSIATGIGLGFITYALAKILVGQVRGGEARGRGARGPVRGAKFYIGDPNSGPFRKDIRTEAPCRSFPGYSSLAALPEERITDKITRRLVVGRARHGGVVEYQGRRARRRAQASARADLLDVSRAGWNSVSATSGASCGPGDIAVIPGGVEHEAWWPEDTEVIDMFSPPREDFLAGGTPALLHE